MLFDIIIYIRKQTRVCGLVGESRELITLRPWVRVPPDPLTTLFLNGGCFFIKKGNNLIKCLYIPYNYIVKNYIRRKIL